MALSDISVADLEAMLKERRAQDEQAAAETPHSRFLADLADHRLSPVTLGDVMRRVLAGFDLLGVDLLAEGGPAKVSKARPKTTADTASDETPKE